MLIWMIILVQVSDGLGNLQKIEVSGWEEVGFIDDVAEISVGVILGDGHEVELSFYSVLKVEEGARHILVLYLLLDLYLLLYVILVSGIDVCEFKDDLLGKTLLLLSGQPGLFIALSL